MQLHHGEGGDSRFDRFQQAMPVRGSFCREPGTLTPPGACARRLARHRSPFWSVGQSREILFLQIFFPRDGIFVFCVGLQRLGTRTTYSVSPSFPSLPITELPRHENAREAAAAHAARERPASGPKAAPTVLLRPTQPSSTSGLRPVSFHRSIYFFVISSHFF